MCLHRRVEPIRERVKPQINVIVSGRGAPDDDSSHDTISVLDTVMRVIPGSTVLCRFELVHPRVTVCDWTLGNPTDTVHVVCEELAHTMPMYARAVGKQ